MYSHKIAAVCIATSFLFLLPLSVAESPTNHNQAENGLQIQVNQDATRISPGDTVRFQFTATNTGVDDVTYPRGCNNPWQWTLIGPDHQVVSMEPPPIPCDTVVRSNLAPQDSIEYTLEWNTTLWQSGQWQTAPLGTYRLKPAIQYFESEGSETIRYLDAVTTVRVEAVAPNAFSDIDDLEAYARSNRPAYANAAPVCIAEGVVGSADAPQGEETPNSGAPGQEPSSPPGEDSPPSPEGPGSPATQPIGATGDEGGSSSPDAPQSGGSDAPESQPAGETRSHTISVGHDEQAGTPEVVLTPRSASPGPQGESLAFNYDSANGMVRFRHTPAQDAAPRSMEIVFESIFEFSDENGNGKYDAQEPILQEYRIDAPLLHFADAHEQSCGLRLLWTYLLTADPTDMQSVLDAGRPDLLVDEPRFWLQFTHTAGALEVAGVEVVPERVKIDIGVEHFPYRGSGTHVGVRSVLRSAEALSSSAPSLTTAEPLHLESDGPAPLMFGWEPTAVADGQTVPVGVSLAEPPESSQGIAADARTVTFAYPGAASIVHDPEFGLASLGAFVPVRELWRGETLVGLGVGAALTVALLFMLAATRRR